VVSLHPELEPLGADNRHGERACREHRQEERGGVREEVQPQSRLRFGHDQRDNRPLGVPFLLGTCLMLTLVGPDLMLFHQALAITLGALPLLFTHRHFRSVRAGPQPSRKSPTFWLHA
jgi:hypothetical protein